MTTGYFESDVHDVSTVTELARGGQMSAPSINFELAREGLRIERARVEAWSRVQKAAQVILPYRAVPVRPSDVDEACRFIRMRAPQGLLALELEMALDDYEYVLEQYAELHQRRHEAEMEADHEAEIEYEQERHETCQ